MACRSRRSSTQRPRAASTACPTRSGRRGAGLGAAHGIRPAAGGRAAPALLLVDVQNTFCLPEFELFVGGRSGRGAVEDSARVAAFLYRNLDRVTQVVATLDTHAAAQIFHPLFWVDGAARTPRPTR